MMIDTHCHIQFGAFDQDREDVLERCIKKGMILNVVGTQKDTSARAVALAERYDWIYASIGLHPIQEYKTKVVEEDTAFTSRGESFDEADYDLLAASPKVIAVGETGLDRYHVPKDTATEDVMRTQKDIFFAHCRFARKHDLPLVIHVRDAHEDMIALLRSMDRPPQGVIHCYSGNWAFAEAYLDLGLYLGFTGTITFPPKKTDPAPQEALREVLARMPEDRMLVETDSPFLAPQAYRGKRAEPWMVEDVLKKIADIRDVDLARAKKRITQNSLDLFQKITISYE